MDVSADRKQKPAVELNRGIPFHAEAEQCALGALLLDPAKAAPHTVGYLTPDDFYHAGHKAIFAACQRLHHNGGVIDLVALADLLKGEKKLDILGGISYLGVMVENTPTAENVAYYARLLRRETERRKKILQAMSDIEGAFDAHDIPMPKSSTPLSEVLQEVLLDVYTDHTGDRVLGYATGFASLDEYLGGLNPGELYVVAGRPSMGKALALDTPMPTPTGWTTMGEVKEGDFLFDEKGNPCNVIKTTEVMFNHSCYKILFSDGTEIIADAGHQWFTNNEKARRSAVEEKRKRNGRIELKKYGSDQSHKRTFPSLVTTEQISKTLKSRGRFNHQIPVAMPMTCESKMLPIKPYTFGAWLGDGHSYSGRITCFDEGIIEKIKKDGYVLTNPKDKNAPTIKGIQPILRVAGLLGKGNKYIPSIYLRAAHEQRLELLKGLMDTDGCCCGEDRNCEFTSTNKVLAENVLELINGLGFKAMMTEGRATLYGKDCGEKYRIRFATDIPVFSLKRKLNKQKGCIGKKAKKPNRAIIDCRLINSVPVKCIEVDSPSHLFLVSKSFIATHNSALCAQVAANIKGMGGRVMFFPLEVGKRQLARNLAAMSTQTETHKLKKGAGINHYQSETDALIAYYELQKTGTFLLSTRKTPKNICSAVREAIVENGGLDVILVDHLQELMPDGDMKWTKRNYQLETILQDLRDMAREYNIPVVLAAQVGRTAEGKEPTIAEIKDSGSIEQIADCILIIHGDQRGSGNRNLIVAKHRNGPTGKIKLHLEGKYLRFEEVESGGGRYAN